MTRWATLGTILVLSAAWACASKPTPGDAPADTGVVVSVDTTEPSDGSADTGAPTADTQPGVDTTAADVPEDTQTAPLDTTVAPADTGSPGVDTSAPDTAPSPDDTSSNNDTKDTSEPADAPIDDVPPADAPTKDVPATDDVPPTDAPSEDAPPSEDVAPLDTASPDIPPEPVAVQVEEGESVALFPPPPEPTPRSRRRMNLDQLQATIVELTGLSDWLSSNANLWELYATPLGRPDFERSVFEDLEPGLLFEKVLGDFVRYICPLLMEKELASAPEARVFIVHAALTDTLANAPELIEKNLRALLLRFHGRYIPLGSPKIGPWVTLFDVGSNVGDETKPIEGWSLVCTGLLSHPDFFSY